MPRPPHWLKANHRQTFPSRVIWVDVESDRIPEPDGSERHVLNFGWAAYRRRHRDTQWSEPEWVRFTTPDEFWDWALTKAHRKTALYILAHNAGYDLTVLRSWDALPLRGWVLKSAVYDSPPFLMHFRRQKMALRLWDTMNWWTTSLAKLGERINLPKLEMPDTWEDPAEADRYCVRDVEICMESTLAWWRFLREHDLGSAAPTLASQALTAFRHKYVTHPVLCDGHEDSHEVSRASYVGGRVECFRLGALRGTWSLYDVRSMYPHVMRRESYPTVLRGVYKRVRERELTQLLTDSRVVAEVDVQTETPAYPFRADGRLLFPVGRFRTTLATPELSHALQHGHVRSIGRVAVYEHAPLFEGFVSDLYALRVAATKAGDSLGAYYLKIMMNSLYGKFGQRQHTEEWVGTAETLEPKVWVEYDVETGQRTRMRQFAGQIHRIGVGGESWWSHPAIASHVTSWARMHLWSMMNAAGLDNVAYCDTDSLLVNAQGRRNLEDVHVGEQLGQLQHEGTFDNVVLRGPKDYVMGSKRRHKGVRSKATWLDENTAQQDQWSGLAGLVTQGDVSAPRVKRVTKHLRRVYLKAEVLPRGRTRPWRLPDDSGRWRT